VNNPLVVAHNANSAARNRRKGVCKVISRFQAVKHCESAVVVLLSWALDLEGIGPSPLLLFVNVERIVSQQVSPRPLVKSDGRGHG